MDGPAIGRQRERALRRVLRSGVRLGRDPERRRYRPFASYDTGSVAVDVAFNGTNYLVVWTEPRGLLGKRIAPDGTILDATPIRIARGNGQILVPTVASNGTNWLASWFWRPTTGPVEIRTGVVRADGGVGRRASVSQDVNPITGDDAGSDGDGYLVAWTSKGGATGPDLLGARLSATGQLLDPTPLVISNAADRQEYAFVSNGSDPYLVTWEDYRDFATNKYDIYGSRVSSDGTVLDPTGIPVGVSTVADTRPSPVWDGTNWLVAWLKSAATNQVVCARVAPDGTVLNPPTVVAESAHTGAVSSTLWGPGKVAVAYGWLVPGPPDNAIRLFLRFVSE